jgi:hypothetical protein
MLKSYNEENITKQEAKPSRDIFQRLLSNIRGGGLAGLIESINPEIKFDKPYQKIKSLGSVLSPDPDDPLEYITGQTTASAGPLTKLTGIPLIAALKSRKLFHGSPKQNLQEIVNPVQPKNPVNRDPSKSYGGVYTTTDIADPRIKAFARPKDRDLAQGDYGAAYILEPEFKRTLNLSKIPDEDALSMQQMIDYYDDPESFGFDYDMYRLSSMLNYPERTVATFNPQLNAFFQDLGYDSIMFPTRSGFFKVPGEAETVVSLNPIDTLKIIDRIKYKDLDDFIRKNVK